MIFFGDIALPYKGALDLVDIPDSMLNGDWFANLEGTLIKNTDASLSRMKRVVYNNLDAINHITSKFPFCCFSLANNHILDVADISLTKKYLSAIGIKGIGAGDDIRESSYEYISHKDKIVIVAFGWDRIKCIYSGYKRQGVNPLEVDNVLSQVRRLIINYPDYMVIPYMHWNTELERYPMPMNRELAHALIDEGCYAVVGCHSHRPEPIEVYKGHPIVYGLGNFLFKQGFYMNSTLKFPEFSYNSIAVEILKEKFLVHYFIYEPNENIVKYISSKGILESECDSFKFNDDAYYYWFRKQRTQRKGTVTYRLNEPCCIKLAKKGWDSFRTFSIDILVKYPRLFNFVKSLFKK